MGYQDKLIPIERNNTPTTSSKSFPTTTKSYQQKLKPITTPQSETKKDGLLKSIVKDAAKLALSPVASLKAVGEVAQGKTPTGITTEFTGNVRPIGEGFDVTKGLQENAKPLKDAVGKGLEFASYIPVAKGLGLAKDAIAQPFKKTAFQTAKSLGKEGLVQGGLQGSGSALQQDKGVGGVITDTLKGTALGGVGGFVLGGVGAKASRAFSKTPADFTSQLIDKDIRKAYQGVTGDIEKLDKIAYGSRKGLELLANESPNIKIPDSKAPLGSGATKAFDIKKANGNEFITAVNKLRQNVVTNARTAVKEASAKGFTLKTDDAKNVINQAVNNGDITPATASRLYKQIDNTKGDAEKIFDWVQEVNQKYKNRFEKGTIDDMATSRIANDIAEGFRKELNTITDRTGYAESMSNIKDLERLLVSVAKKANKNINFGDITSEAGLDAGISLLTGNPAYMARTLGSGIFKGIVGKIKNTQGLRSVKSAIGGISKIPNETKMPSAGLKQSRLMLTAPKAGTPKFSPFPMKAPKAPTTYEAPAKIINREKVKPQLQLPAPNTKYEGLQKPINMPSRKAIEQGTEIVPNRTYIPDKNIPKIKVENAPKGHSLNIGFNIGDGTRKLTEKQIIKEIKNLGVDVINSEAKQSGTEKTLIPQLSRGLTETELGILAKKLEQDAIAQLSDGIGTLNGPKYKDWGGKFSEEYYLKPIKKKIDFEHYSVKKGLSELDPSFQFTGAKGSEGYLKNYPEFKTNYINLYKKGVKPEQLVLDAGGHKYSGSIEGSFLEVGSKEFKEIGDEARKFIENNEKYSKYDNKAMNAKFIELVKQKGYDGIEAGNAVQYFNKINIDNKQKGSIQLGTLLGIGGSIAGTGIALKNLPSSETIIERPKEVKSNNGDKLGKAIMQLESSGGTNKANADAGEKKWLMGLTEIAIKELKNQKLIDDTFDKNNEKDVIDAGIKYFNLMKKRNPKLSDAEIYVDKYWGGSKSKEQRKKKMDEFNRLIK